MDPDGRHVVVVSGHAGGLSTMALFPVDKAPVSERSRQVITSAAEVLSVAVMSPDARWIAFRAGGVEGRPGRIAVISATGGAPSTWRFVTAGDSPADKPAWSDDGAIIYFVSAERGAMNVWGVRFDARRGTATGEPFRITNFDGPGAHILSNIRVMELSAGGGRIVVPVVRPKGGLWLLRRQAR
jgi:Tol biopolymer transport system component